MQNNARPDWLNPPQMPPVLDLINFWIARMENLSGMSPMTKGQQPPTQRMSQASGSQIQEAAFVRIRAAQRNLEKCLESAARKQADLIIQNYTEPRLIATSGIQSTQAPVALQARHFQFPGTNGSEPLHYSLLIQAGATHPTSRQSRIAEADKLYAMSAIDRKALLESHQYPQLDVILSRIAQEQAMGLPIGAPRQRSGSRPTG
jgi:hypothetical protein